MLRAGQLQRKAGSGRQGSITLKGSANIVVEFFEYAVNSILYQRGLYPSEDFKMIKKYGLGVMMTTDDDLKSYLGQIFDQLEKWLLAKNLSKFILAISDKESGEVIERWQFDIQLEQRPSPLSSSTTSTPQQQPQQQSKTEKEVHAEISGIIRQITSSISFLPILEQGQQTFQVLVYTDLDAPVPATWTDSDARLITTGAQQVRLKSFSTSVHKVDSLVAYKVDED